MADTSKRPHSSVVVDGNDRAPARSMLRAVGFTDDDFQKPQIAVASSPSDAPRVALGPLVGRAPACRRPSPVGRLSSYEPRAGRMWRSGERSEVPWRVVRLSSASL